MRGQNNVPKGCKAKTWYYNRIECVPHVSGRGCNPLHTNTRRKRKRIEEEVKQRDERRITHEEYLKNKSEEQTDQKR